MMIQGIQSPMPISTVRTVAPSSAQSRLRVRLHAWPMLTRWPSTPRPITIVISPVRISSPIRSSSSTSGVTGPTEPEWPARLSAIVSTVVATPTMARTMAARPTVATGLRRMVVTAPDQMSPRPSGRSGMPPGCGAPAPLQPPGP